MSAVLPITPEQYAERIRRMIWEDTVTGRVPTVATSVRALGQHVRMRDYLDRAEIPVCALADPGPTIASILGLVDEWIRTGTLRLPYGVFTAQDVTLLTHYLRNAARHQSDVAVIARIAGEWLAGIHAMTSAGEYTLQHSRALLALAHDVLAR
jgi:hypothetical protein